MAKSEDAVAVNMGQGTDARGTEVARDQLNSDCRPRYEGNLSHVLDLPARTGLDSQAQRPQDISKDRCIISADTCDPHGGGQRFEGNRAVNLQVSKGLFYEGGGGGIQLEMRPDALLLGKRIHAPIHNLEHLVDGSDAADRYFGKGKGIGHCTDHTAVDVDRTAAHSGNNPGLLQGTAGETGKNQVALRTKNAVGDTENLRREGVDGDTLKNCFADAPHTAAQFAGCHEIGRGLELDGASRTERQQDEHQDALAQTQSDISLQKA